MEQTDYTCKDCFFFKNGACNHPNEIRFTSEENPSCTDFEYKEIKVELEKYNNYLNTKDIKGKWGDLKVSGKIDNFEIKNKKLILILHFGNQLGLERQLKVKLFTKFNIILKVSIPI